MHPIFLDFVQSYQQPAYRYWLRFQSTLPARGATAACRCKFCKTCKFQSTLPARGATGAGQGRPVHYAGDFNPRSPRGERPGACADHSPKAGISIHAPREGSDGLCRMQCFIQNHIFQISIHAPREGSDPCRIKGPDHPSNFNPRSPRGERLVLVHLLKK